MIYALIILSCLVVFLVFMIVVILLNFRDCYYRYSDVYVSYYSLCKMLSNGRRARKAMRESEDK